MSDNKKKLSEEEKQNLMFIGEIIGLVVVMLIATALFMFMVGSTMK